MLLAWVWGVWGRRSPTPDCPPSGQAAGAHYPLAVGAGGAGVETRHRPHTARSCELALRAGGAARGRPGGGGASCLGVGRPGLGALPPPTARLLGGLPGPTTRWLWVRGGAGVGTRHQPHSARSCVLWGRHGGARGGRLLPGRGASGVGRSPTPDCPPSGRAAGAHYPLAVGAGGCGRGDPSPTPQRVLLRAGFAHCGGGTRAPGGGASCLGVGRPGSGALPTPTARPLGGLPGPTTYWLWVRGGAGVGTRHQPHSSRSYVLWGRHEGARGGRLLPGCGAFRVGRSPTPDCPPSGRAAGAHYPLAAGAGGAGVGTRHQTHSARSCVLWGRHEGAWGGRLLPGHGASGVGRSPTPDCPPSGRAAGVHYPLAVPTGGFERGDPSPTPQRALLRAGFARCGGGMRVSGGGASCLGVGRPGSGALPPPTARPLGGLPGPTTHWLWVRGDASVGTRHQPHSVRSCDLALRARGAARGRPGGGASCLGVGRPRSGALAPPTACPLGRLPGPSTHWLWVRGGAGVGTRHQPHSVCFCVLWGRHGGARGGRLLPGCGASGVGRSPTPDCLPSGRAAGAHYPLAVGTGGCGRGDPSPTPQCALLRAGFAHCGGGTRAPGGGASCLGPEHPGSGALPPPTGRPLGGLPGPTTYWLLVRGGAGVGARQQPHSARCCELALRAVGAA